jgi:hypothetical protein
VPRRHVLAALAEGIAAGDSGAARAAIARTEWLLRGSARRRLDRTLVEATLLAGVPRHAVDPETARHVQRVAALTVVGAEAEFLDRERVAEAYAALPPIRRPRAPIASIVAIAALVALVAGGVVVARVATRSTGDEEPTVTAATDAKPRPPPVAGAFRDGGRPPGDPALEQLLVGELTDLVIETDRDRNQRRQGDARRERLARLREAPAIAAHGARLAKAWRELLDLLDRFVHVGDGELREVARSLRHAASAVSDELAAAGVGLYLEGYVRSRAGKSHATIYSYRVEEVVYLKAGTERRRVLSLRRIDPLNRSWALLGMQSDELGDPVVLLDKIDEHVATTVLPVLAPDAEYSLGWEHDDLAEVVGAAVRRELLAGLAGDAPAASQVAALLAERAKMIASWRDWLKAQGLRLGRLEMLHLPAATLDSLEGKVGKAQLQRARAIEAELVRLEARRIADRVHGLVTASVRRHECQHGLEDDRATPLRYPASLEALLGPALDDEGEPRRKVERARSELSAYLSEIANDPATTQMSLWHVGRTAFDHRSWGSAECYAALVIVEGLARHVGVAVAQPVVARGAVDRERLAVAARALARAPGDRLREAARALWLELYGEPLVPIVD